jgi:hypothetical protein
LASWRLKVIKPGKRFLAQRKGVAIEPIPSDLGHIVGRGLARQAGFRKVHSANGGEPKIELQGKSLNGRPCGKGRGKKKFVFITAARRQKAGLLKVELVSVHGRL